MSLENQQLNRRQFNLLLQGAVAHHFLSFLGDNLGDSSLPTIPFASVFSIHDAPRVGGSLYLETMLKQLKPLRPKYITGLNPRPEWYEKVAEIGAQPIVRLVLQDQQDDPDEIKKQLLTVPVGTRIVARNETNLVGETGGVTMYPWTAADYDARSIPLIVNQGCIPLLTPTSPEGVLMDKYGNVMVDENGNPYYEFPYYETYIRRLEELGVLRSFPEVEVAFHGYNFQFHAPWAPQMWERIRALNEKIIIPAAGKKPIHVTEGGIFLADVPIEHINYVRVGEEITKLIESDIPVYLAAQLQSFAYWIYAVDTQTSEAERQNQDSRFEKTALCQLLQKDGQQYSVPNAMYNAIYTSRNLNF